MFLFFYLNFSHTTTHIHRPFFVFLAILVAFLVVSATCRRKKKKRKRNAQLTTQILIVAGLLLYPVRLLFLTCSLAASLRICCSILTCTCTNFIYLICYYSYRVLQHEYLLCFDVNRLLVYQNLY